VDERLSRIIFIGQDIELRMVSLIVRARESAHEVLFFDQSSTDESAELAREQGCQVHTYLEEVQPTHLATFLESIGETKGSTLLVHVKPHWKLSDLPFSVNRAREGWDMHYSFQSNVSIDNETESHSFSETSLVHCVLSNNGIQALRSMTPQHKVDDFSTELRIRCIESELPVRVPQRESLATASRFAQLFYWMLESKHPLLLFGIPGVVLFVFGYRLSGNIGTIFTELNSSSIGFTLATIAMTLVGLFAMMVAIILYIMGKQVERIQHQYNWPKDSV